MKLWFVYETERSPGETGADPGVGGGGVDWVASRPPLGQPT